MPQHVLVTGGCGFFGAAIVKRLLEDGDAVTVFDVELLTKRWEAVMGAEQIAAVRFVQGKVDEPGFVAAVVAAAPDAIIHLAGLQMPTCRANPVLGAMVNVIGSLNVFEAAKAMKAAGGAAPRIVYASSAAVFGPDAEYGEAAVGDSSVPKPSSHYGAFKLCVEHAARAYHDANGLPSVGLRPLTVYGPGRDQGLTSFPSRSIAAVLKGQAFHIPFSGDTAYIHVREVADMFVTCARRDFGDAKVYTVGGDTIDTTEFIRLLDEVRAQRRVSSSHAACMLSVFFGGVAAASNNNNNNNYDNNYSSIYIHIYIFMYIFMYRRRLVYLSGCGSPRRAC